MSAEETPEDRQASDALEAAAKAMENFDAAISAFLEIGGMLLAGVRLLMVQQGWSEAHARHIVVTSWVEGIKAAGRGGRS